MNKIECNSCDLSEKLDELQDDGAFEDCFDQQVAEQDEEHCIVYEPWFVEIPSLDLKIHEGTFLNYDEDEKEYFPDFSLTIFFDSETGERLYWEQDDIPVSLHNYLHAIGKRLDQDIDCNIVIP